MDRHELNRMFDGLNPDPERGRELLDGLLQDGGRRTKPMKNWKRVVVAGAAVAALLVTVAAAATVPGISQRLLEYMGVKPENGRSDLLSPGAASLDISVEDNGITLHITEVLRESRSLIVMADFTAEEGTVLDYSEEDQFYSMFSSCFHRYYDYRYDEAGLLDKDGNRIEDGPRLGGIWRVIDDDDLEDNHLTLVYRTEFEPDSAYMREAVSLRLPSPRLYRFKSGLLEDAYSGNWACVVPVPQTDTRWTLHPDHAAGELDGAVITVEKLYLSPATLNITLKRDHPATVAIDWRGAVIDQEEEDVYVRWSELAKDAAGITLMTKDGRNVPVELYTGDTDEGDQWWSYRLDEVTNPAQFQGGTLTLDWAFGTVTIPLDNLAPVEP